MGISAVDSKQINISYLLHEIKTPLIAISGMAKIAKEHKEESEVLVDYLDRMESTSFYLLDLINDILALAKAEDIRLEQRREEFNLSQLLNSLLAIVEPLGQEKSQTLSLEINTKDGGLLLGDPVKLQQILLNLLTNAIKYTSVKGSVVLSVDELGQSEGKQEFRFVTRDSGIGMSKAFMKTMFDPFTQEGESLSPKRNSTGLGLYITKKLVDSLNGSMTVESEPNVGTIVTLELSFETKSNHRQTRQAKKYQFGGKRLLLAEDNQDIKDIITDFLKQGDLEVETAASGLEAIRLFLGSGKGYYNGILMDITMPELSGLEATKEIRNAIHPDATTIPIIALSAHAFMEEQEEALQAGMNAYLTKPLQIETLFELLHTLWKK